MGIRPQTEIGKLVMEYLRKFPTSPSQRIARMIHEKHPEIGTQERIRSTVRQYRGAHGAQSRIEVADEFYSQPYDLPIPETYDSSPFIIPEHNGLLLADLHIPYHDNTVIKTVIDWTKHYRKTHPLEFILINGDLIDCYQLSHFVRDPRNRKFKEEIEDTKDFLQVLNDLFKVPIYFKEANHERRYETYLYTKADELVGVKEFDMEHILHLKEYNCTYITDKRVIKFGHLNIIHGDEYQRGMNSPVSPARTVALKAKEPTLVCHWHKTSEQNDRTIGRKLLTCWSVGCLCSLSPKYAPLNDWNNGFASLSRDEDVFRVINLRIEEGVVY
jgi:hypothetical protein